MALPPASLLLKPLLASPLQEIADLFQPPRYPGDVKNHWFALERLPTGARKAMGQQAQPPRPGSTAAQKETSFLRAYVRLCCQARSASGGAALSPATRQALFMRAQVYIRVYGLRR